MAELKGDFRKYMNKKLLGSWDLPDGEDLILTIDHVQMDELKNERGTEEKLTLHFREHGYKPMVCNTTNSKAITKAYGSSKVEDWKGKRVALYKANVSAFGSTVEAVRIRDYAPKSDEFICEKCGSIVTEHGKTSAKVIANRALSKFGRVLCYDCAVAESEAEHDDSN